jgi:hypothetical protein
VIHAPWTGHNEHGAGCSNQGKRVIRLIGRPVTNKREQAGTNPEILFDAPSDQEGSNIS